MKRLTTLWNILAEEMASRCCTSATMDIKTVQGRSKCEGFSFYTISLANFCRDFQISLDRGYVGNDVFTLWSKHASLPRFLGGFSCLVFDRNTGVLLNDPSIEAILAIRQLTLLYSKILLPCTSAREKKAMDGYIECESQVRESDSNLTESDTSALERISSLLYRNIFSVISREIYDGTLIPRHGPGKTADKLSSNGKFNCRTWTTRLEEYFPAGDFLFPSNSHYSEEYERTSWLEPGSEIPVKVVSVPKTQKTPRIIGIEPTCQQYCQQAILEPMIREISNDLVGNFLGFEDQSPNQTMALEGSLTGDLATLDLSEASDRVSLKHVQCLMSRHSLLLGAVQASRSEYADVPGHGVQHLAKFASMGSALTFPIEAMLFLSLVFLGIERELNTQFSNRSSLRGFIGRVRIYGDDIIIPKDMVPSVISTLEHFGVRVGGDKSFWNGKFRESCGKEYYDGHDVSIVKVRRVFPSDRKHVQEIISLVSLRNQLYMAGCWKTVQWLDPYIRKIIKYFPRVLDSSPVLGRLSFLGFDQDRMCDMLHRPLVKGLVVSPRIPSDSLDGAGALLKFFLKRGSEPTADERHLERAGRPRTVDIKTRWATPY